MRRMLLNTAVCVAATVLCLALTAIAADAPVLQILSARPGATVEVDRLIVIASEDIASWNIVAANAAGALAQLEGKCSPAPEQQIALPAKDLKALAAGGDITVKMALKGMKGQALELSQPVKISFVETSQRSAEKQDQKVQEKYAPISCSLLTRIRSGPSTR